MPRPRSRYGDDAHHPCRLGERQLRALLAETPDAIDAAAISSHSVAVQGLPALERLLHGDAADVLAGNGTDPATAGRCHVATAIAGNVAAVATTLDEAWSSDAGVARQLRSPRADDPLFRTTDEIVRRLLTQLDSGLGVLLERKIGPVLDADPPSLRGAPFARSGETWTNLAANIESLRSLAIDTGLAGQSGLEDELGFEFRTAAAHVAHLARLAPEGPRADALDEEESGVLRALLYALANIRTTLNERLLPSLGMRTGFNAEDGDGRRARERADKSQACIVTARRRRCRRRGGTPGARLADVLVGELGGILAVGSGDGVGAESRKRRARSGVRSEHVADDPSLAGYGPFRER